MRFLFIRWIKKLPMTKAWAEDIQYQKTQLFCQWIYVIKYINCIETDNWNWQLKEQMQLIKWI